MTGLVTANRTPQSSYGVALPRYSLKQLEATRPALAARLVADLISCGAIIIEVEHYGDLHAASLRETERFFLASEEVKATADGLLHFKNIHGHAVVELRHGPLVLRPTIAELLAQERGWVRRGQSPSKADKEYFQYGTLGESVPKKVRALKHNVWPIGGTSWRYFKSIKEQQLAVHDHIHKLMIEFLQPQVSPLSFLSNSAAQLREVICRETLYHPSTKPLQPRCIRNPPHVDLSNGTLICHVEGLQLYCGIHRRREDICQDELHWFDVDTRLLNSNSLIYMVGLATEISSRGEYSAVWHRVTSGNRNQVAAPRMSIVSFGNAGIDDLLDGGVDQRSGRSVYPTIARNLLPVLGNKAYCDSIIDFRPPN